MPKREKAHDRVERIIRELLKLPENRRCINCNSLGPQYICTTFWTFVCTSCSGVHREFTHRVKSVSMAKFSEDEVSALQAGGNERARQIYFKEWDPLCHSFPDGSNQNALRDFIKHVYVDRKYTGERTKGKLAMVKAGSMGSSELNSIEGSPQHKGGSGRSSSHRSRPLNFEIVDDRVRDNRFESSRRSENHRRTTNAELRTGSMSPVSRKSGEMISPPVVHPVKDILGVNVPPLQVGESPKASDIRDNEGFAHDQNTESSSDPVSVEGKSLELKRVNSFSLIDFSADPEPPDHATETQTQQTSILVDGGTGASSTKDKASDAPNVNSLESILFVSSIPAAGSVDIMSTATGTADAPSPVPVLSNSIGAPVIASTINIPASLSAGYPPAVSPAGMAPIQPSTGSDSNLKVTDGQQLTITQPNQPYQSPYDDSSSSTQNTTLSVGVQSRHLPVEANSSGRNELPADLFTYAQFPAPVPRWQIRPPHGMGSGMWYNPNAVPGATFPNPSKSRNPFDLDYDSTQSQLSMFPSMLPLQEALPNSSAATALLHTSDARSSQLMQLQASPYAWAYMGQQMPNDMPFSRPQGSRDGDAFASLNPLQQPSSRNPASSTSNSFPTTGNPFG